MRIWLSRIALIGLCLSMTTCKPRRDSYLSDSGNMTDDEKKVISIDIFRAYSLQLGIHVANHPIYKEVAQIVEEVAPRVDKVGYYLKLHALGFLVEEMNKKSLIELKIDQKIFDFKAALAKVALNPAYAPLCQEGKQATHPRFVTCYDYSTCDMVVNTLNHFAAAAFRVSDGGAEDDFSRKISNVREDVECLEPSTKSNALLFRIESVRAKKDFHQILEHETGRRPVVARRGDGHNAVPSNTAKYIESLTAKLNKLVIEAEDNWLMADDPARLNLRMAYAMMVDEILRPDFNKVDIQGEEKPDPDIATIKELIGREVSQENVDNLSINLTDSQNARLQTLVDDASGRIIAAHIGNRAMLFYLKRLAISDIRPWLNELKSTVLDWRDWQRQWVLKHQYRPSNVRHISPYLAYAMLASFVPYEMHLPFRHEYLETMKYMIDRFEQNYQFGQDVSRIREAQLQLNGLQAGVQQVDQDVIKTAEGVGFYGKNLIYREKDLAIKFTDFHSLLDEFIHYGEAIREFADAHKAFQDKFADAIQAKRLEKPNKEFDDALTVLKGDRIKYLRSALNLACMNFASGQNDASFFDTGFEKEIPGCGIWKSWFRYWNSKPDFDITEGLTGTLPLNNVCGFTKNTNGEFNLPLSRQLTQRRIDQINFDKQLTDECAKKTAEYNASLIQLSVMAATMPIMGAMSGIATRSILNRLSSMAIVRGIQLKLAEAAVRMELGQLVLKQQLAYFATRTIAGATVFGFRNFLAATSFEVANRSVFSAIGWQNFVDPEKGFYKDWGKSIGLTTVMFMGLHPAHILGTWAAVRTIATLPMPHFLQMGAGHAIPFMTTALYFSEANVHRIFDSIAGEVSDLPEQNFLQRFSHALVMTASFSVVGKGMQRMNQKYSKGAPVPNVSQVQMIMQQAKILRNFRVGTFNNKFMAQWEYHKPTDTVSPRKGDVYFGPEAPPIDFYSMFGIINSRMYGESFSYTLNSRFNRLQAKYQKYISDPKTTEVDIKIAKKWWDGAVFGREVLSNPAKRAQYDQWYFHGITPARNGTPWSPANQGANQPASSKL